MVKRIAEILYEIEDTCEHGNELWGSIKGAGFLG
jgi:hypothetical protein